MLAGSTSLFVAAGCSYKMRFHYKFKPAINTDDLGKQVVEAMTALAALPRFRGNKSSVFEGFGAESHLQFDVSELVLPPGPFELRPAGAAAAAAAQRLDCTRPSTRPSQDPMLVTRRRGAFSHLKPCDSQGALTHGLIFGHLLLVGHT